MSSKYIINYINFHTTVAIKNRGIKLYKEGAIESALYDSKINSWLFNVKGSREYLVKIDGLTENNIVHTSCTCPFDWGSTCKHTVAALLYIDNGGVKNFNKKKSIKEGTVKLLFRTREDEYEIKEYKKLTKAYIKQNTSTRIYNDAIYDYDENTLVNTEIVKNKIVFTLNIDYYKERVTIRFSDNKAFINTTEDKNRVSKLTKSEILCLFIIEDSQNPDLLDIIFNDKLKEYTLIVIKKYGFSEDTDFYKYFGFEFINNEGLIFYTKDKGLLPVDINDNKIIKFIEQNSEVSEKLPQQTEQKEKRELGFVIYFEESYYNKTLENIRFRTIIGKTDKKQTILSTKIEEYDNISSCGYNIKITDNQEKILSLINNIEDSEYDESLSEKKQILHYLSKEKFVYISSGESYDKIRKKHLIKAEVSETIPSLVFNVSETKEFIKAELKIKIDENEYKYKKSDRNYAFLRVYIKDNIVYALDGNVAEFIMSDMTEFKMLKEFKSEFFNQVLKPLSKNHKLKFNKNTYNVESVNLDFTKKQVYLSEKDNFLIIKPQVVYDNNKSVVLYQKGNILDNGNDSITEYNRNFELEDDYIELISTLHPEFEAQKDNKIFYLPYEDFNKNMWFYKFFDQMQQNHVEVFGLKELKNFKYSPYKGKINTTVSSGQDWFELDVKISFGDNNVSLQEIKKAILNKQKYIQLGDGSVGIMPSDWLHKLEKYFRNGQIKKDKLEISKLRFSIIDEMFDNIDDTKVLEEIAEKQRLLSEFKEIEKIKIPKEITAELRDYQKEGLNWLNFLDKMKWGGILADDMGLGKTLQILTFIQHIIKKNKIPNLIVVPTSLLFNWQNEIEKFAPKLKAFYHYGANRKKETEHFNKFNLVFTTYGTLLRDIELFSKFKFNYLILDESQAIKNPASRRYKAAVLINANNKIALTGTPIENGTFDLYAQMNFANPGMFPSLKGFKDDYSNPIDKDADEIVAGELQKIINPFVLRRTKEKVASELPSKTEDIIYCEMESEQRKVYDAYRNNYKDKLLNTIEEKGIGKSKLMVLEALTRLRQICDSPELLKDDEISVTQAIKVKEIIRHISEKTANHKILIFSQFVGMLSIVKNELSKLNISYEYLDGKSSTKQRENSVNNFQNNEDLRVFMISLKAGGTGLNLTAADYVFILDPWWNPAVENQAIDRCYRIGQDKKVFAYRMICKNTVEEKIMKLQEKKKKIAVDIIQTDENIMKNIDTNDIKQLFS